MKFKCYPIIIVVIFICIIQRPAFAQNFSVVIQGNVLDAETNLPVDKVNVFLSGTTLGASTDANGKYVIRDSISTGKYTVVFSHIKYKIEAKELSLDLSTASADTLKLNVLLIPTKTTLEEITIKAAKDITWKRRFKHFEEKFLGTSALGRRCKITNPWVLDFKKHRDTLIASANKEIIVENQDLGYKIYCKLVKFHNVDFVTNYLAYYRFKKLAPSSNKQAQKWERARTRAFYGSFQHFASSLLHNRLSFYIKYRKIPPQNLGRQDLTTTITAKQLHNGKEIIMPHYLNIVYNQREEMAYIKAFIRQGINLDASTRYNQAISQSSWISITGGKLKVSDLGVIMDDPTKLQTYGYWAWQRVGNLLPSDFVPTAYKQTLRLSKIAKVKELTQFSQNNPQEKVYLHQDKPYYAIGDTMWVSGYVVDAKSHRPTKHSGVLYIDLIDQQKQLKKRHKLKIDNGKAAIDIPLDTSFNPGRYHLRAYTKLMTLGDHQFLFQREFEVGQMNKSTFEGKLTYQNKVTDNKESVEYKLALKDQFGQVLSNQVFDLLTDLSQSDYFENTNNIF